MLELCIFCVCHNSGDNCVDILFIVWDRLAVLIYSVMLEHVVVAVSLSLREPDNVTKTTEYILVMITAIQLC